MCRGKNFENHQNLFGFNLLSWRYKTDLLPAQKDALKVLIRHHTHYYFSEEILRELSGSTSRGEKQSSGKLFWSDVFQLFSSNRTSSRRTNGIRWSRRITIFVKSNCARLNIYKIYLLIINYGFSSLVLWILFIVSPSIQFVRRIIQRLV